MNSKLEGILEEIFQILIISYLALIVIDSLFGGQVSKYISLDIIFGLIFVYTFFKELVVPRNRKFHEYELLEKKIAFYLEDWSSPKQTYLRLQLAILISIVSGCLVFISTKTFGILSAGLSITMALIVFLVFYVLMLE